MQTVAGIVYPGGRTNIIFVLFARDRVEWEAGGDRCPS